MLRAGFGQNWPKQGATLVFSGETIKKIIIPGSIFLNVNFQSGGTFFNRVWALLYCTLRSGTEDRHAQGFPFLGASRRLPKIGQPAQGSKNVSGCRRARFAQGFLVSIQSRRILCGPVKYNRILALWVDICWSGQSWPRPGDL